LLRHAKEQRGRRHGHHNERYTLEDVSISGSIKNANSTGGSSVLAVLDSGPGSSGTWINENIRNIAIRNMTIHSPNAAVRIDATNVSDNLILENLWTYAGVVSAVTDPNNKVRARNVIGAGPSGVGDYVESAVPATSAIALTTATQKNVTSILLPAGEWDVSGAIYFAPTSSTNIFRWTASVSATSQRLMLVGDGLQTRLLVRVSRRPASRCRK
jgi:hypothetical protein